MNIIDVISSLKAYDYALGATFKEIEEAQKVLGLVFADEYIRYLSEFGAITYYGHELTGITPINRLSVVSVTTDLKQFHKVPNSFYVIEELNIDGIVIWQDYTSSIFQSTPDTVPIKISDSLADYIQNNQ